MTILSEVSLAALPEHRRELARLLLAAQRPVSRDPRPRRAGHDPVPATRTQRRLCGYLSDTDPANGTGSHAFRLRGPLDADRLTAALTAVLARHEALRTRLVDGPDGLIQVIDPEPALRMEAIDLSGPARNQTVEIERRIAECAHRALDITGGTATRYRLLRIAADDHILVLSAHLALFDGWSSGVLLADLVTAYRDGSLAAHPPPAVQFPDYAVWQRDWLAGPDGTAELDTVRRALAGIAPAPAADGFERGHLRVALNPEITAAGFALGASCGATRFMTLLAALGVVLARLRGQDAVVIGTPTAGRFTADLEAAIGQFTTVVPVRLDLAGSPSFRTLLDRTRTAVADALAHQRLPTDAVTSACGQPYSVLFALHNYPTPDCSLPDIEMTSLHGAPARHLELYSPDPAVTEACVGLVERDGVIAGTVEYNRRAVDAVEVNDLLDEVQSVLAAAVSDPHSAIAR